MTLTENEKSLIWGYLLNFSISKILALITSGKRSHYFPNKLDNFPLGQLSIVDFSKPFRFIRDKKEGSIILFIYDDMSTKLIFVEKICIKSFFINMYIHKKKWLKNYSCNVHKNNLGNHVTAVGRAIDAHSWNY